MKDEEIKSIKYLKDYIEIRETIPGIIEIEGDHIFNIYKNILNVIERQEKEIKELKNKGTKNTKDNKTKERQDKTLKVLNKLKETDLKYELKYSASSQINIYLKDNQLIVYYVIKKTMYYKPNSKIGGAFNEKCENIEIEDVITFANKKI